jgi:hypothetical protein
MTQDEIIEMADKAHGAITSKWWDMDVASLERFAKLVAEREREEIAQFIERTNLGSLPHETALHYAQLLNSYSTAIRERGNHD